MNLQDIIEVAENQLESILKVDQSSVWDYKESSPTQVSLISENTWKGAENETVTLSELINYCKSLEIDFSLIEFLKEETNTPLTKVICKEGTLILQ